MILKMELIANKLRSQNLNESEDGLDNKRTWSLECELTLGDDQFKDHISSQVWVTYYPKIIIPKKEQFCIPLQCLFQIFYHRHDSVFILSNMLKIMKKAMYMTNQNYRYYFLSLFS